MLKISNISRSSSKRWHSLGQNSQEVSAAGSCCNCEHVAYPSSSSGWQASPEEQHVALVIHSTDNQSDPTETRSSEWKGEQYQYPNSACASQPASYLLSWQLLQLFIFYVYKQLILYPISSKSPKNWEKTSKTLFSIIVAHTCYD